MPLHSEQPDHPADGDITDLQGGSGWRASASVAPILTRGSSGSRLFADLAELARNSTAGDTATGPAAKLREQPTCVIRTKESRPPQVRLGRSAQLRGQVLNGKHVSRVTAKATEPHAVERLRTRRRGGIFPKETSRWQS